MILNFKSKSKEYEVIIKGNEEDIKILYEGVKNREASGMNFLKYYDNYSDRDEEIRKMFMVAEFFTNRKFETYIRLKGKNIFNFYKFKVAVSLAKYLGEISDVIKIKYR